jgi:N-acetylglucosaminyl-diphospho-decaprenol L-rhamnosyltransferase
MASTQAVVRVGIVSWNTAEDLVRCLGTLPAALDGLPAEIVVVDNGSADGSAERAEQHPGVQVVRHPDNQGYARAMNEALAGTSAPVLVALNPDTVPPPGALRTLVEALLDEPDVGLVFPQLRNSDGTVQHSVNRFPSVALTLAASLLPSSRHAKGGGGRWWVPGTAAHATEQDVDWGIGAVHVIRSAALGGTAPYNERWFMYAEDLDLCWRLARAGWRRRLVAGVSVPHVSGAATVHSEWADDPALRWIPCSYDFYASAHSRPAARVWAGANALALVLWGLISVIRPGWLPFQSGGRRAQLHQAVRLRHHLWIHLVALLAGPSFVARRVVRTEFGRGPALPSPRSECR